MRPHVEMEITALVAIAVKQLGVDVPTAQNLLRIGVTLAQEVNKASALPGRAKLDLVVHALRGLLEEPTVRARLSPEVAATLQGIVRDVIPETISLVVDASRGAFQLKKPSVGCVARIAALFCRHVAASSHGDVAKMAAQAAQVAENVASSTATPENESETKVEEAKDTTLTLRAVESVTAEKK
jgi:hypothetical protein